MWWILMGAWVWVVVWIIARLYKAVAEFDAAEARKEALLQLAEQYGAASTDKERARLYRKAEALGFTEGPFALDTEHPHPRDAA